jgi:hypothetical protein
MMLLHHCCLDGLQVVWSQQISKQFSHAFLDSCIYYITK